PALCACKRDGGVARVGTINRLPVSPVRAAAVIRPVHLHAEQVDGSRLAAREAPGVRAAHWRAARTVQVGHRFALDGGATPAGARRGVAGAVAHAFAPVASLTARCAASATISGGTYMVHV